MIYSLLGSASSFENQIGGGGGGGGGGKATPPSLIVQKYKNDADKGSGFNVRRSAKLNIQIKSDWLLICFTFLMKS